MNATNSIQKRIAELESTPRALVASDSATHGKPDLYNVYEEITGERYATYSFAGSNASRCPEEDASETPGRLRRFPKTTAAMRAAQRELRELRELKRQADYARRGRGI